MLQCLSMGTHVNLDGAMKVRAAKQGDLGWLLVLHSGDAFNRWIMRGPEDLQSLADEFSFKLAAQRKRQGVFIVVDVNGIGRGYGALLFSLTGDSAHVEFGVDPRYQRKGIGGALLDEILRAGCRIGPKLKRVKAVCHQDNEGCIRLLRSRGFMSSAAPDIAALPYLSWHLIVDAGEVPAC